MECGFCHLLVDPDPAVDIPGTIEVQNSPFEAYTGTERPEDLGTPTCDLPQDLAGVICESAG